MALKSQISLTFLTISILALELSFWFFPAPATSTGATGSRPISFKEASQPVILPETGGIAHTEVIVETKAVLRGVTIRNAENFPVVQQPPGETNYVSKNDGEVTQFSSAEKFGNIGLLAHNYLAGRSFSKIKVGQEIHLAYSDGSTENFIVMEILRYKALDPKSPYSSFQNLDDEDEILTVGQMFDRAYQGGHHVTFQTCIAAGGDSSWGRLFIIASPVRENMGFTPARLENFP